jgi:hypothetical protein
MAELGEVVEVDPLDPASIRAGIERAERRGSQPVVRWPEAAAATWAVYEELAS